MGYFVPNPRYDGVSFRRRYRINQSLFLQIMAQLEQNFIFLAKWKFCQHSFIPPICKRGRSNRYACIWRACRCYRWVPQNGTATARETLTRFCEGMIGRFGEEYLRSSNEEDLKTLLAVGEKCGFPGILGSIDCMHLEWKNCPKCWDGMYSGKEGKSIVILEFVASHDLWIWHSFFDSCGSCNDINVLHRSPVFEEVLQDQAPLVQYTINGHEYTKGYYLADGVYPDCSALVKIISAPEGNKE